MSDSLYKKADGITQTDIFNQALTILAETVRAELRAQTHMLEPHTAKSMISLETMVRGHIRDYIVKVLER